MFSYTQDGHVYIADNKELEGITFTGGEDGSGHLAQSLGLFYAKSSGDLG